LTSLVFADGRLAATNFAQSPMEQWTMPAGPTWTYCQRLLDAHDVPLDAEFEPSHWEPSPEAHDRCPPSYVACRRADPVPRNPPSRSLPISPCLRLEFKLPCWRRLPIIRPAIFHVRRDVVSHCASAIDGKDALTLNEKPEYENREWSRVRGNSSRRFGSSLNVAGLRALLVLCSGLGLIGNFGTSAAEVEWQIANVGDPISVSAAWGQHWRQGSYEVWILNGVEIRQGPSIARAEQATLWIDEDRANPEGVAKVIGYLEGRVDFRREELGESGAYHTPIYQGPTWFGRWHSRGRIGLQVGSVASESAVRPAVYQRALAARDNDRRVPLQRTQFANPGPGPVFGSGAPPGPLDSSNAATAPDGAAAFIRSIRIESQGSAGFSFRTLDSRDPNETVAVCDSGVHIIIDGISNVPDPFGQVLGDTSVVDIVTDRIVVWTDDLSKVGLPGGGKRPAQPAMEHPIEFYLEGNIVFRQGDRVIYADRMYYNVADRRGVVLNAELLTPAPGYQGLLRLKADVLQQVNESSYLAQGAALTSSRLGVPRYWLQSETVQFQDIQETRIDARTGLGDVEHHSLATSNNNWVYLAGIPVFYWPTIATDLQEPSYYLQRVQLKSDGVFGTQFLLDFDAYQLFGIGSKPPDTEWQLSADLLSERGVGLGTNYRYQGDVLFGLPGPYRGYFDAWGINDGGLDNLGSDRRTLIPEEDFRGRVLWQHRQYLSNGFQFTGELGLVSDRNFLEQYYEREWDQNKDQTTGLELKRFDQNQSYALSADVRVNDFFTQTEWLPRLDHFLLGQSLLFDRLTWNAHSSVGYARLRPASTPSQPLDAAKSDPLAWEAEREGLRAATRQEIDLPFELGPVKVVPYVLGEAATWGEDLAGDDVTRLYGQAGIRSSLPIWRVDASVQSELFNLNGLAHKIQLESDLFYADANRDLGRFPLYDALDDDSIEHFRRRLFFNTFGGTAGGNVHPKFDERIVALRSGLQGWVTSPATEVADDMLLARLGLSQRWQTKRGLPGQQRIVDWIVFDLQATVYPNANRDNFGQEVGLIDYDFRWHIGDRVTLLSDGFADVFGTGLKTASIGGVLSRPELGSLFVGFRTIEGPVHSNALTATANYRMNEKWIFTAGTSYDFGDAGNIGQIINLTRIGESFLVKVGFNWDVSRGNVGANFSIEPRFLPISKLGRVGGVQIPPSGTLGLE